MRAIFARRLVTPKGEYLRGKEMNSVEEMENVYVVFDERIVDVTREKPGVEVVAEVDLLTPGFVDPHTHIPFYGFRDREFVMRAQGAKYVDILKAGGGIHSTVERVRRANEDDLLSFNTRFALEMARRGVTTLEGKSGYGLEMESELKQLRVLRRMNEALDIDIVPTFLGAHAVPKGRDAWEYLEELVMSFGEVKKLASFVDIFVDEGAYTVEQAEWYLKKAKEYGFEIRLHADEIKRTGAARLGVELGARSVDHLLKISDGDVEMIASSDTVALMMPGTSFYLNEGYAPARKLVDAGAIVALGSDFNPGSCAINDPTFIMHLAVSRLKMSPQEALTAFTLNSAYVLNLSREAGSIEEGKRADMVGWSVPTLEAVPYLPAHDTVEIVVKSGKVIWKNRF